LPYGAVDFLHTFPVGICSQSAPSFFQEAPLHEIFWLQRASLCAFRPLLGKTRKRRTAAASICPARPARTGGLSDGARHGVCGSVDALLRQSLRGRPAQRLADRNADEYTNRSAGDQQRRGFRRKCSFRLQRG